MSGFFVYTGVVGFLLGVATRSLFELPLFVAITFFVFGAVLVVLRRQTHAFAGALGIFLILFSFGVVRTHITLSKEVVDLSSQTKIQGLVIDEPQFTEKSQKLTLKTKEGDRVRVIAEQQPAFRYGDTLSIDGEIQKPESFETDSGNTFNYPRYLAKSDIYHQSVYPKIEIVSRNGGDIFHRSIFKLRREFIGSIQKFLPEPDSSLVSGISIGAQDGMDANTEEVFRRVGLIHIVVLSGYNITVVSDTVMRLLSFLPRMLMLSGGGVIVVLFVIMTGASATAVRAGSMAVLALLGRMVGARYDISRALFLVAGGMVLYNPLTLLYDPSFQLSFLATLGLIKLSPILDKLFVKIPNVLSLRETISATLSTQIFVLPLLVYMTGQVSVVSLLANIIVLPTIPTVMFFGSLLGIFGKIKIVGMLLSFPTVFISKYILFVSELLAKLPFASVSLF